jgi:acyl carrier protein
VSNQLGVEREELVPQARILDDLGADSLDVVELMMALEESFDITVPDEDVEALQTLLDVQQYLELRTAAS